MKNFSVARTLSAVALALLFSTPVFAQEARPWLCRDKPVFSYERAMEYQVTARPGHEWRIFFMKYSPDAAHDGFDIVDSREVHGDAAGSLAAGQYFAVALHRQGSHWICPSYTQDDHNLKLGEVSNLCYGEGGPPCLVNLVVTPDHHLATPPSP